MDSKEIENKVKNWFSKTGKSAKETFEKAGDKVQDWTDKSLVKIEISKLEGKKKEKADEIGKNLYAAYLAGSLTFANDEDKATADSIQEEIKKLDSEIENKKKELGE